jgi:hypothetical protein
MSLDEMYDESQLIECNSNEDDSKWVYERNQLCKYIDSLSEDECKQIYEEVFLKKI